MSQKNRERLHLIYGTVLSALVLLLGVCLILSCITIYKSGDRPFTVESISAQFDKIMIPTLLCVLGIIGGIVISLAVPTAKEKTSPIVDSAVKVDRLRARLVLTENVCEDADKIAKKRKKLRSIAARLLVLSAVPIVWYLLRTPNFTSEVNKSVISLVLVMLPCAALAFGIALAFSFFEKSSLENEARLLKEKLSDTTMPKRPLEAPVKAKKISVLWIVRGIVFSVAAVFILLGILNGGMSDVLEKAIKICTECIGLG